MTKPSESDQTVFDAAEIAPGDASRCSTCGDGPVTMSRADVDEAYVSNLKRFALLRTRSGALGLNPVVVPEWLFQAVGRLEVGEPETPTEGLWPAQLFRHDDHNFDWLSLMEAHPALSPDQATGCDVRRILEVVRSLRVQGARVDCSVAVYVAAEDRFTVDVWMLQLPLDTPSHLVAFAATHFAEAGGARMHHLSDAAHWEFDASTTHIEVSQ